MFHLSDSYDCVVIGAGVFGSWSALELRRSGRSVALIDAHGPANSRASSGGESRIIRMSYGPDEIYTRWSHFSLERWQQFFADANEPGLFHNTGVLWTVPESDARLASNRQSLENCGVRYEELTHAELERRFPQFRWDSQRAALFEPDSGVLLARRAVQAVVREFVRNGGAFLRRLVNPADGGQGSRPKADGYVYACGPWLPALFPELLGELIQPTRQEIFFFGTPAGDSRFAAPQMPAWLDYTDPRGGYSIPDIESRGFKLAFDCHGPDFDPENGSRVVAAESIEFARAFLRDRFPALKDAPAIETRVCQYENTSNGDFLIDRHPDRENVWIAGGGSGHGFKHGPAVGDYVAKLVAGQAVVEPRFSFESKQKRRARTVF